jgi:2-amino-4-hydroxy-6-hydroxymethyldihydropteridine diphosphokinase
MSTVFLALGSNVGDREENLRRAITLLHDSGIEIRKVSALYETEPVDYLDQSWFLNAVLEAETKYQAIALLTAMRGIEQVMGSNKPFAKGPRLIDLDLLLYADQTVDTPDLQIPHPRMLERRFVLIPLVEIAPQLRHPSWPGTAKKMLDKCPDTSEVRKLT